MRKGQIVTNETFDQDFTWHEWTFVTPDESSTCDEGTAESQPEAWTSPAVGMWGEEWVWTT